MNQRERFAATMHYQSRDRSPICDFGFWDETLEAWYEQGLPRSVDRTTSDDYFGMDLLWRCVLSTESTALVAEADPSRSVLDGVSVGLMPPFDPDVLEDRGVAVMFRRHYGKDFLLLGGFDKRILARSKAEIEAEVRRLAPLVEEGGYIGFCDHRVPPDVPLENYVHYLATVRRVWGR